MVFNETALRGAFKIEPERREDERGFFARSFCREEFTARGLNPDLAQCNISFNRRRGTLRGMHFRSAPYAEAKLVRCTMGAVYDVVIDLRPGSPTFKRWVAVELSAENRVMLYVPEDFAHGFQTLTDNTELFYQMSGIYRPEAERGVRWNDPAFSIGWPILGPSLSERDQGYEDFTGAV